MRSRVLAVLAGCAAVAAGLVTSSSPAGAQTEPSRAIVYGDSLTWEAQAEVERAIEAALPGWDAVVRTTAGSATCDTLPLMRGADGDLNARVVVLEYVGVPFGPCMNGKDPVAQHTADTRAALALWKSRGVAVVLVGAPRGVGEPRDETGTAPINRELAAATGESYVDAGVLLRDPWTGVYQQRLPCLDGEGPDRCGADGLIDVRDETGGHFCSIHEVAPCPVYSSGIVRFSASIADAVARAAGAPPPAQPGPPNATALEESVRALFTSTRRAGATSTEPPTDDSAAEGALLAADAIPPDFSASALASTVAKPAGLSAPECRAIRRALKAARGAAAAEVAYAAPITGARIDQVVHVLPNHRRAREIYKAYTGTKAARCLGTVIGVPVTVDPPSAATQVGDRSVTYRAAAARNLVIRIIDAGRTVTALTFANAVTPPPPDAVNVITEAAISR